MKVTREIIIIGLVLVLIYLLYQNRKLKTLSAHPLDKFQAWLEADKSRQQGLPEWERILSEVQEKARNYHLVSNHWSSGFLKNNSEHFAIFSNWLRITNPK